MTRWLPVASLGALALMGLAAIGIDPAKLEVETTAGAPSPAAATAPPRAPPSPGRPPAAPTAPGVGPALVASPPGGMEPPRGAPVGNPPGPGSNAGGGGVATAPAPGPSRAPAAGSRPWEPAPGMTAAPGAEGGGGAMAGAAPPTWSSSASANAQLSPEWGPPPAPGLDPRRFAEAHWQGLEVVPKTRALAQALQLPPDARGVIVDDVTLPADLQGFQAGDLVTHVGGTPTPDLTSFVRATERVREQPRITLSVLRGRAQLALTLTALFERLGNANAETAPMIPPGSRRPHAYRGPCVGCHSIGSTGNLPVDQGNLMTKSAPTIRVGARSPHRDRGPCQSCHRIVP